MKLSHLGLEAFHQCALSLNMTVASKVLGITQSALSQRISSLEDVLEVTLFIRDPKGLMLTEQGHTLLRHAQFNLKLENELLEEFQGGKETLGGSLRIAGFSSVMRSLIIPTLSPFLRKHSRVQVDFQSYEVSELPEVLSSGRADYVILDYQLNKKSIIQEVLCQEEYVVIESVKHECKDKVYLDHGPQDNATESYFAFQGKVKPFRRTFMGDVYGIIQGVEEGLGRAVMSRHLIEDNKKLRILKGYKPYSRPITLHYYERPFNTKLMDQIEQELKKLKVL